MQCAASAQGEADAYIAAACAAAGIERGSPGWIAAVIDQLPPWVRAWLELFHHAEDSLNDFDI